MEQVQATRRRGREPIKALDLETFRAIVRRRALLAADPSLSGMRPPSLSQVCAMLAKETGRSVSTIRGRFYANPLSEHCKGLDPQEAQLVANGSLAALDGIAAALPAVTVMGWRDGPSFMAAICHRLDASGTCKASPRYIDDLPSVAQWDIAQACGGEWPEVRLIGCADIALLMADAFQTMPGDGVDWIWAEPTEALTDLVPIIVTLGITVPASLLAFEGDGALR